MKKRIIYADRAATTPVSEDVLNAMLPYFSEQYGNASGIYSVGREARKAVESSRDKVAAAIGCLPKEIFFTGSGTEADNWAIIGAAKAMLRTGRNHVLTSSIEHHAVLNTCHELERNGINVSYIEPDKNGIINPKNIERAITDKTGLISLMTANNEIGTIQPVYLTGQISRKHDILFHTDAVQAVGHMQLDTEKLGIDLMSISGHKIYGPKGVGALYVRSGTELENIFYGGAQERTRRPGTENVPAIVGFGTAIENAVMNISEKNKKTLSMCSHLTNEILKIPGTHLNGDRKQRLPGNCNITIEGADSEELVLLLDLKGICVSGGSACTSGSQQPSHVIKALNKDYKKGSGTIRFSIDEHNTPDEIDYILEVLPDIIKRIRR